MRPFARDIGRLRDRVSRALDRLEGIAAVEEHRPEIEEILADLGRRQDRADRAAVVCLVGSTGAGKSTLLNALAGRPVAQEGVTRPTTVHPTIHLPRDADRSPFSGLECDFVEYDPEPAHAGGWSGQVFIDAPDWNSFAVEHRETARRMVERADVLLVVAHRQSIREQVAIDFLREHAARRRHMVFVLGRADELTPDDRAALVEQVRAVARDELGDGSGAESTDAEHAGPQVFAVDARTARQDPEAALGFGRLVDSLRGLADQTILEQIRRSGLTADENRLRDLAASCRERLRETLEPVPQQVAGALHAGASTLVEDAVHDLELRLPDLERQLADEAGKRWNGPGGWALRTGSWTSGGVGLALLLARRHPLTGAAAAGAGAAAGLAGRFLRGHRLGRAVEGAEPRRQGVPDKITRALDIPLQDARRSAGRAFVDEDARDRALGRDVLDAVSRAAALHEVLDECWQDAVTRDLPERARTALPLGLRLALDLPFYALAVYALGYHVVFGYLTGDVAGLDFVINTLLIAGMLAVAVRWAALRWLAHHARRTKEAFAESARTALQGHVAGEQARLEQRVADVVEAVADLAPDG